MKLFTKEISECRACPLVIIEMFDGYCGHKDRKQYHKKEPNRIDYSKIPDWCPLPNLKEY